MIARIQAALKRLLLQGKLRAYQALMRDDHPFKRFPMTNVGDCSASPKEFFSHYDAFAFWCAERLQAGTGSRKILDVGNRKATNALFSLTHEVTALVLEDCEDRISRVRYATHDIARPLPFEDASFDVFTSCVSLHLVGLGRYGDELNPYSLLGFVAELDRVLTPHSELLVSITYGRNGLIFNNGWIFDLETLKTIFAKWQLKEFLIDNHSTPDPRPYQQRFVTDPDLTGYAHGEYRVIFLHFVR